MSGLKGLMKYRFKPRNESESGAKSKGIEMFEEPEWTPEAGPVLIPDTDSSDNEVEAVDETPPSQQGSVHKEPKRKPSTPQNGTVGSQATSNQAASPQKSPQKAGSFPKQYPHTTYALTNASPHQKQQHQHLHQNHFSEGSSQNSKHVSPYKSPKTTVAPHNQLTQPTNQMTNPVPQSYQMMSMSGPSSQVTKQPKQVNTMQGQQVQGMQQPIQVSPMPCQQAQTMQLPSQMSYMHSQQVQVMHQPNQVNPMHGQQARVMQQPNQVNPMHGQQAQMQQPNQLDLMHGQQAQVMQQPNQLGPMHGQQAQVMQQPNQLGPVHGQQAQVMQQPNQVSPMHGQQAQVMQQPNQLGPMHGQQAQVMQQPNQLGPVHGQQAQVMQQPNQVSPMHGQQAQVMQQPKQLGPMHSQQAQVMQQPNQLGPVRGQQAQVMQQPNQVSPMHGQQAQVRQQPNQFVPMQDQQIQALQQPQQLTHMYDPQRQCNEGPTIGPHGASQLGQISGSSVPVSIAGQPLSHSGNNSMCLPQSNHVSADLTHNVQPQASQHSSHTDSACRSQMQNHFTPAQSVLSPDQVSPAQQSGTNHFSSAHQQNLYSSVCPPQSGQSYQTTQNKLVSQQLQSNSSSARQQSPVPRQNLFTAMQPQITQYSSAQPSHFSVATQEPTQLPNQVSSTQQLQNQFSRISQPKTNHYNQTCSVQQLDHLSQSPQTQQTGSPSPVVKVKVPVRKRGAVVVIDSDDSDEEGGKLRKVNTSSPWLSKTYGQQNGVAQPSSASSTPSSASPSSSQMSSQTSSPSSQSVVSSSTPSTPSLTANKVIDYAGLTNQLACMFLGIAKYKLKDALIYCYGDFDNAVEEIKVRMKREASGGAWAPDTPPKPNPNVQSYSPKQVSQPSRKRIRLLSDSSTEGASPSKTLDDDAIIQRDLDILQKAFPQIPRQELLLTLSNHGSVEDAIMSLGGKPRSSTENVGSIKAYKAARVQSRIIRHNGIAYTDDDNDGSVVDMDGNDEKPAKPAKKKKSPAKRAGVVASSHVKEKIKQLMTSKMKSVTKLRGTKSSKKGMKSVSGAARVLDDDGMPSDEDMDEMDDLSSSDSEAEYFKEEKQADSPIVQFLNEATLEELMVVPGCSKKKAELVAAIRPFADWADMANKLAEVKMISLVGGCKELMATRKVVNILMKKCEGMSRQMNVVVNELAGTTTLQDVHSNRSYISEQPEILTEGLKLKPYQMVGLNWLALMHQQEVNGILADEMGLGKTIQTISFLAYLLEEGEKGPHCIIAPSSTLDNWLRELRTWCPDLKVMLYYGSQDDRRDMRNAIFEGENEEFNVLVTTYNMATGGSEDRSLFKRLRFTYAVFDEGHMLKNMSSLRYQNLMKIRAHRRLLLTGTPLQNNLIELMSLLCFVMPDMFSGKTDQLKRMFMSIGGSTKAGRDRGTYERETISRAKHIMKPFVLRRLKTEVLKQLPKKVNKVDHVPMAEEQHALYKDLVEKFSRSVNDEYNKDAKKGASMLMELRKAANHPLLHRSLYDTGKLRKMAKLILTEPSHCEANEQYVFEDMEVMSDFELHQLCKQYSSLKNYRLSQDKVLSSGKFAHLDNLLPNLKEEGHRVLLFSQFVLVLNIIEVYLKERKYKFIRLDGSTPVAERQELIDKYTDDETIFVFLLSTKAGGLGINLIAADTVILHDIDFNPYNDKQAEDRCHRVGQHRDVSIYRLVSEDSIEEGMLRCANSKLQLEQDVTSSSTTGQDKDNVKDVVMLLREALNNKSKKDDS